MKKIRILLADDHAVLRAGLRMLIDAQPDMKVVAEAADGREAVRKTREARADVALVDLAMPGMSGMEAIARIRKDSAGTRVLVLTMHEDPAYARATLAAGAAGHVTKDVDAAQLLAAIRAVHRGRGFVEFARDGSPARDPVGGAREAPGTDPGVGVEPLSTREQQVLALLVQGHTNREVADRLSLSVKTVETYRARLGDKLGLRTRAELVRFALDTGLFNPPGGPAPGSPP